MQPQKMPRQRTDLYVGGERRVSVTERMARIAERDERLAADTGPTRRVGSAIRQPTARRWRDAKPAR